tara:strand:+ start:3929 stop:4105 length:177 start_codon:yes stop_codon:yes gene_type:complete
MTEGEALTQAQTILEKRDMTKDDVDRFYELEQYIEDFKFGDLIDALFAVAPIELHSYL